MTCLKSSFWHIVFLMLSGLSFAAAANSHYPSAMDEVVHTGIEHRSVKVDKLFKQYLSPVGPGCSVGVRLNGKVVHANSYGYANLDYKIPISTTSVFRIASISKQFTAMAIAFLIEQNELELEDKIGRYLPELHKSVHDITIKELITHSSGLDDIFEVIHELAVGVGGGPIELGNEDYIDEVGFFALSRSFIMESDTEKGFYYSNLGYFWLARIVEKISGKSLREFTRQKIFVPAGLNQTFFNDNVNQIVVNRATGYADLGNKYEVFETNLNWVGDGGVYSSVDEFLKWDKQFDSPSVGKKPTVLRDKLSSKITGAPEVDKNVSYGYGLYVINDDYVSDTVLSHTGQWVGFSAIYSRFLRKKFSYVVFCNLDAIDINEIGRAIEKIYL